MPPSRFDYLTITQGKSPGTQRVTIYGPEGVGKTCFASCFPDPLFIPAEDGIRHVDVKHFPVPATFQQFREMICYIRDHPELCMTLVVDTLDAAERLCMEHVCKSNGKKSIEDFGYGRGYTIVGEEFQGLLKCLDSIVAQGIHVVLLAHAHLRKIEQPDELGAYDHFEMKLCKQTTPLIKEWCDILGFANFKTLVTNVDGQGAAKGKNKAAGCQRVLHLTHHACWDAKARCDLPPEVPLSFEAVAHVFAPTDPLARLAAKAAQADFEEIPVDEALPDKPTDTQVTAYDRLKANCMTAGIHPLEIMALCHKEFGVEADLPPAQYTPEFIEQKILADWAETVRKVETDRLTEDQLPF
jgi:hypothetical protein